MRPARHTGITAKLIIAVLGSSALIYVAIIGFNHWLTQRLILKNIDEIGEIVVSSTIRRTDAIVNSVERMPDILEIFLDRTTLDRHGLDDLLEAIVQNIGEITGSTIAFEPYAVDPMERYYAAHCYRKDGSPAFKTIGGADYDYFGMSWYRAPKDEGHPVWSEPYLSEEDGGIFVVTYAAPFYRTEGGSKIFRGVVAADVSLEWLGKAVSEHPLPKGGYAFIVSKSGTIMTFPKAGYALRETLSSAADRLDDEGLRSAAAAVAEGGYGDGPVRDIVTGKDSWIIYSPLGKSGLSVCVVFEEDKVLSDVFYLTRAAVLLGLAGLAAMCAVVIFVSRRITRPIVLLSQTTGEIARGNLDVAIPNIATRDEVEGLARSFASMRDSLKRYIGELTDAAAARERIESQLKIAHDIQMSFVPKDFSEWESHRHVRVAGLLVPAREVGGDLYNVFPLDGRNICFVVGDVSDKGLHAALIMAVVSTLVKALPRGLVHPDDILRIVNREIVARNETSMFVTLFCGVLETGTGRFRYANAGHVPPFVIRRGEAPRFIEEDPGVPIGIDADAEFSWRTMTLEDGDTILMYTDGMTDAVDERNELFGEARLSALVSRLKDEPPEQMVQRALNEVKLYSGTRPLADDIALLAFTYCKG